MSSFELCHGRARFISYILDSYISSRDHDLEMALDGFIIGISNVDAAVFPLRYYRDSLDNNGYNLNKVVGGDTINRLCSDALCECLMTGSSTLRLKNQDASDAIRYGLGFCEINQGVISSVTITEIAVIECLRYLIPFSDVVFSIAKKIESAPKPQMVGYLLEYLVAYTLVSNLNPTNNEIKSQIKSSSDSLSAYISSGLENEVFFPNHCCGPDIIYKHNLTIYIVQVKFVKKASKQERVDACHTTDPDRFYWNNQRNCVLKGFEQERTNVLLALKGYRLKRIVFLHSNTKTTAGMDNVEVVSQLTKPDFFNELNPQTWEFLNRIRKNFG